MFPIYVSNPHITDYSFINLEDAEESGAITWCEAECGGSQWDQGFDDFTAPCNADRWVATFESYDEDHHGDHHDDHHDDHDDDDHEEASGWEFIFPDEVFIDSIKGSTDQSRLAPNRTRTSKMKFRTGKFFNSRTGPGSAVVDP